MSEEINQTIYEYGGSSIWSTNQDGRHNMICDTYEDEAFAKYILKKVKAYRNGLASLSPPPPEASDE